MLKPFELACACAALFLLHPGSGQAAGQATAWPVGATTQAAAQQGTTGQDPHLADDSLEQPADIVVASVSRQQGRLGNAAASWYVISGADTARSGATTIPEALCLAPKVQAARGRRLSPGGVLQDIDAGLATNGPRSHWQLRSLHDLGCGLGADLPLRRVARLPQPAVPGYHELDARIAWQARPGVELALAGRNLLHARHPEFGTAGLQQLAERSVFASALLRF